MDEKILELRLLGLSYKKIGIELNIGKTTVENRLKKIYKKADMETKNKLDKINNRNRTTKDHRLDESKLLELRLEKRLTTQEIADILGYSRISIEKKLKQIYKNADTELKEKIDTTKHNIKLKQKINLKEVSNYQLGIIWSIGRYTEDGMFFRAKDKYFLEQLQLLTNNKVTSQKARTGIQYKLKSVSFDIQGLKKYGWTERNAVERDIPILNDYKDFLRAYIEIHGRLDKQVRRSKKKTLGKDFRYYVPRLRIYGNITLIESINGILHQCVGVGIKSPQIVHNGKTAYIAYASLSEIEAILMYISGKPWFEVFWENIEFNLQAYRLERQ